MAPRTPSPLRLAIVQSGRTQRDVAQSVGLTESRLSLIVNGHWNPDDATRQALADELRRTTGDLFPAHDQREAA